MSTEFVQDDENILEMDNGDGCTKLRMYLMALNCTLKTVRLAIFMLYIFYYDYFLKSGSGGEPVNETEREQPGR